MIPDELREFCLALPQATETFPFDESTSVFKTSGNGKIFALSDLGASAFSVSLKCDPDESVALRSAYPQITPGYHLNKKHWITIDLGGAGAGAVPDDLVEQLITDSHRLVRPKVRRPAQSSG
ncbi:MmcQ/YjbR family DNA-binding protein [Marisediminicola sp. LYQ85]|uniref:MmcQ/YjbR family DNA-binding protein n=1 Tax=Marisediminicola sp. LYQ85 TaxID=3391062 RepID=UPI00398308EA